MKRKFLFAILLIPFVCFAQKDTGRFVHPHLFRAALTISPGFFLNKSGTNIYLHGSLEYYLDEHISFRGDGFYFFQSSVESEVDFNHSILSGASYHFSTHNHFDPYIGLQPGISIARAVISRSPCNPPNPDCSVVSLDQATVSPLISPVVGFNYYFQKVFHLFGETRFVYGKHLSNIIPVSLSEIKFSFGLGFNFN